MEICGYNMIRKFKPGDIILTGSNNWISKAIRWVTRYRGEEETIKNHAGIGIDNQYYVEALWTTKKHTYDHLFNLKTNYEIWRNNSFKLDDLNIVQTKALEYVGLVYAPQKIALHLFDGLLSKISGKDIFIFRKLAMFDRYPICSWVVAFAYDKIGYRFNNLDPKYATPDCLHDHLVADKDWKIIETNHEQKYTSNKLL